MAHTNNKLSTTMKYEKTLAVLAGLTFAGSLAQAQIAIGETLTVSGFADASYVNNDDGTETSDFGIDQVEVDLAFSLEAVTAEVHLQTTGGSLTLEQAFASTNLGGITVSAGRMLNLLGLESDEPTNLVTDSWAYSDRFNPTLRYNEGIRGAFSQGDLSIAASVTDSYGAVDADAGGDFNELAFDVAASYSGIENLSVSLGYATNNAEAANIANELSLVNINATYSLGQINISGEYSDWELGAAEEADSYLIMGTYSVNDDLYLAARYSEVDSNVDGNDEEKFTVAAGYDVTDNLQTRVEYSSAEVGGADDDTFAVQGILNF